MYLRTTQRKNKDGSVVRYLHLAHNVREPETGVSVPHNIHNFGRADELDREVLVRLCGSIARACGMDVRDPAATGGTALADRAGLPDDVRLVKTIDLGTVMVVEALWEKLGVGEALRAAAKKGGCKVPYERALLAMTANRLCEPESKLGVWDRWLEKVYLPTCHGLKLAQMYEAMDLLHQHSATIEERVFFETANLFNLEVDVVFYDTTTATFSIDEEDEDEGDAEALRKFGRPKDGGWAPQVVVALAVTRDGLPVRSWVFPGNTSDVTTVKRVKADLKGWKLGRALFVADSGMNSEESRKELAKACGTYLLAARAGSVKEIRDGVLARPGRYKVVSDNLQAKEVVVGDGERRRRYIVCYNPKQAERERTHREQVVEQLEEELGRHREKQATAQWAIQLKASGRFGRYLRITKGGKVEIDRAAIREAERFDGKWVVQTNDDTITAEDAAAGYKALLVIERCFRSLKRTQLKMTPMWHWLPRRIEAHVKICVLALLIERVAERTLGLPWARVKRCLAGLQASYFETDSHGFVERNEPTPEHVSTLRALGIPLPRKVLEVTARS
jgi:transposase